MRVSPFEQQMIDKALIAPGPDVPPATAVVLIPDQIEFLAVLENAISPALRHCGFNAGRVEGAFDSGSWLSDVVRFALGAEILVADVTGRNPDVMYALGLCHGVGRCPLLLSQDCEELPFHLDRLRCVRYTQNAGGLYHLKKDVMRAVKLFLAEARRSRATGGDG